MRAAVGFLVVVLGLAGCVGGPVGSTSGARSCITTVTGPDGKPQQAVIESDDPAAAMALCEGDMASAEDISRAMLGSGPVSKANKVVVKTAPVRRQAPVALPDVAGVAQTTTTQDLGGGHSVKTFTYGTPPDAARAKAPAQPRPAYAGDTFHKPRPGMPGCDLKMVGGTGYVCASN